MPAESLTLDCRGKTVPEAGAQILAAFNASAPGNTFAARVDADTWSIGLRMWLLEAGARHSAVQDGGGSWCMTIERGMSPALVSVPGLHHLVGGANGAIWTCERGHRVLRIDGNEKRIITARAVARKASHLALHEPSNRLFVADADVGAGEVIALRADDLSEVQRWPAPGNPQLPLASPEGIVCVTGGVTGTLTVAWPRGGVYHTRTIAVGANPHDPLLSDDGEFLFVPCAGAGELVKVRLGDAQIVGRFPVGDGPSHLALSMDGSRVYSANSWDGTLSCVTADGELVGSAFSGRWAHAIAATPDGRWVYVANFLDDTLSVFDAGSLERVAVLATDAYPHGLDISHAGRYVIATGFASNHVRVYDCDSHVELARIEVGQGSSHSVFAPDCGTAFIGCSVSDHVACVDLAELRCVARLH